MKQVIQNMKTGKLSVADVPLPQIGNGEVLVATKASLISAGTEKMLAEFANKSLLGKAKERPDLVKKVMAKMQRDGLGATLQSVFAKLEEPLPLGYSAAGEVLAVGEQLKGQYKVGDRVVMAGAGIANHAEVNAVPKNLLAKLPDEATYANGCYATVASIAMHGVRNAEPQLGDNVLVMGLGLVGQLAVQLLTQNGARVFGVDYAKGRLELAKQGGAQQVHDLGKKGIEAKISAFTEGKGFDSIVICAATDSDEPVRNAADWARDRAKIVLVGKVGTELPYADYMKKELQFIISRSYGPGRYDSNYEQKGHDYPAGWVRWTERENLAEAAKLIAEGRLNTEILTTHDFPIEEAEDAYALVMGKDIPFLGVVLTYGNENVVKQSKVTLKPTEVVKAEQVGIAAIGAGNFARAVLFPALAKLENAAMTGITTKGGLSAATAGERFGFAYASGSTKEILNDKSSHAVLISTRHDSHADLVSDSLKAGKHVFVEKPLALNEEQLSKVEKAYAKAGKILMVGFNRRFSHLTQKIAEAFDGNTEARQVIMRVNAGKLDADNWQNDSKTGGGRLLGEGCHFIDLALYLAGSKATSVFATAGQGQDVYAVTIQFENGGVAQIFYTSEGDSSASKERVEVYGSGIVGVIDNFQTASVTQNGRTTKYRSGLPLISGQDKGHAEELKQFVAACKGEQGAPIPAEEFFATTRVTLLAHASLNTGKTVDV